MLIDTCCHCGKDLSKRDYRPDGYYYLSSSLIAGIKCKHKGYRLCTDCFNDFKKVVGDFFIDVAE